MQASPEKIDEALQKLSSAANNINIWAKKVSLRLNPDKTKAIYFGTSHFVDQLDKLNLPSVVVSEGVTVPFTSEVKSLGVILDTKLTWESHISLVSKKVNRVLYTLLFIRQCANDDLRINLYNH